MNRSSIVSLKRERVLLALGKQMAKLGWAVLSLSILTALMRAGPPNEVTALVAELGALEFQIRETASKRLQGLPDAAPWVRRVRVHPDPEIANRAKALTAGYQQKRLGATHTEVQRTLKANHVDCFLEWHQFWRPAKQDDVWQPGFDLGQIGVLSAPKLLPPSAKSQLGRSLPRSLEHLQTLGRDTPLQVLDGAGGKVVGAGCWLIRTDRLEQAPSSLALAVVKGDVQTQFCTHCYVFALGAIGVEIVGRSVVVSDGVIRPWAESGRDHVNKIDESLVVAHGNILGPANRAYSSVLLAGGDVEVGQGCHLKDSTIIAGGKVTIPKSATVENCVIKENVKNPTAPFAFFEVADVGLTLGMSAKDAKGLPVGEVKPDTPFGKAGVKKGDTILAIDDAPPGDAEAFRVKLRRAIVVQGDTLLTVSRDGKSLDLPVYFPLPKPPEK